VLCVIACAQSTKAAEPSADCCNGAFPWCNDMCQKSHHFQMDINLPATVFIKLHAEASASMAPWGDVQLKWTRWVQRGSAVRASHFIPVVGKGESKTLHKKKVPFFTMAMHLASICFGEVAK